MQQPSGKPIRQPADFPNRLIVSLRTTPRGEALLRENRSKLYGIATLCSQRPPASWWLPPQFTCLLLKL
jgi:hypothetical protein